MDLDEVLTNKDCTKDSSKNNSFINEVRTNNSLTNKALTNATYENTEDINFKGYNTWAKPVKIYDGDTCHFAFYFADNLYRFRIRLSDIDTAEIRSDDEEEVKHAKLAKKRLKELMGDDLVYLKCKKLDKYGRILAYIFKDDEDIKSFNELLVEEGLAYRYDGGKRLEFKEWYSNF